MFHNKINRKNKWKILEFTKERHMARIVDYEAMNIVGDKIRQYRIERNLSQEALAAKLETLAVYVCRGSISRIEKKERTVTDFELKALAEVLNVEIADFFSE